MSKITTVNDVIAKINDSHRWKGNILQKLAEEIIRSTLPVEEVVKNDVTERLLKELEREVRNQEIISLQINAKPRMAKSTLEAIS